MTVKILNPQYQLTGALTEIIKFTYTKRFYDVGSFEMTLSSSAKNADLLKIYHIIKTREIDGFILHMEQENNRITISGYDLCGLLERRYSLGSEHFSTAKTKLGVFEYYLLGTVDDQTEETGLARNISDVEWSGELFVKNSEILKSYGIENGYGYDITVSPLTGGLVSSIYKGMDLSNTVIFRDDDGSIAEWKAEKDCYEKFNAVTYKYVSPNTTAQRYIYSSSSAPAETERNELAFQDGTFSENQTYTKTWKNFLNENDNDGDCCTFAPSRFYKYGFDYRLGDFVRLKLRALGENINQTYQITEITKEFEGAKENINVSVGSVKENIIKKLARRR